MNTLDVLRSHSRIFVEQYVPYFVEIVVVLDEQAPKEGASGGCKPLTTNECGLPYVFLGIELGEDVLEKSIGKTSDARARNIRGYGPVMGLSRNLLEMMLAVIHCVNDWNAGGSYIGS